MRSLCIISAQRYRLTINQESASAMRHPHLRDSVCQVGTAVIWSIALGTIATAVPAEAATYSCTVDRVVSCQARTCTVDSVQDGMPLHFDLNTRKRTIQTSQGEGTRVGTAQIAETATSLAAVGALGPVRQGRQTLPGGSRDVMSVYINKRTRTFVLNGGGMEGSCDRSG